MELSPLSLQENALSNESTQALLDWLEIRTQILKPLIGHPRLHNFKRIMIPLSQICYKPAGDELDLHRHHACNRGWVLQRHRHRTTIQEGNPSKCKTLQDFTVELVRDGECAVGSAFRTTN